MPSCLWERQNGRMLTDIAIDVRMAVGGQSDWYPALGADIAILDEAIEKWEPSITKWTEEVDEAVKSLVVACLREARRDNSFWLKGLDDYCKKTQEA